MTAELSENSDFDHFLNIVISDLWVNCKYQYCILKCFFVVFNHFRKLEVESKFCQKLKIFMTAVLSEISDFYHFLNIVTSDLLANCKCQNNILKVFCSWFEGFVEVWGRVKILSNIGNLHDRGPERKFRFWPLFEHCHFWLVMSELQVSKWYSKVFFSSFELFVEVWGWVKILVINWKFWWPRSLAKFQILTTFWTLLFWLISELQVSKAYSKVFFCCF